MTEPVDEELEFKRGIARIAAELSLACGALGCRREADESYDEALERLTDEFMEVFPE